MKKAIIFISLFMFSYSIYGQSSEIVATAYKQVFRMNNTRGEWPDHWTTYESEGRSNPVIRITKISGGSSGYIYRLQMYINNIVQADFYVTYDSQKSVEIRKEWNDHYVNCYKGSGGDYVFTQKVSLESISIDNSEWKYNENSQLYLMIYSEDYCVVIS